MTEPPALAAPNPPPRDLNAHFVGVLAAMVDAGARIARRLEERDAATPNPRIGSQYEVVVRSMRRTIALIGKLQEPPPERPAPPPPPKPVDRVHARQRVIRNVEDMIRRRARNPDQEGLLRGELDERLDDPEFDDDLARRPIEEIIEEICRDLGIGSLPGGSVWMRRTPADLLALRTRAAAPTKPKPNHHPVGPPKHPPA